MTPGFMNLIKMYVNQEQKYIKENSGAWFKLSKRNIKCIKEQVLSSLSIIWANNCSCFGYLCWLPMVGQRKFSITNNDTIQTQEFMTRYFLHLVTHRVWRSLALVKIDKCNLESEELIKNTQESIQNILW